MWGVGDRVELITRSGCHLCEEAERALREAGVSFLARDVDSDPELFQLYDWRVPVLLLGGEILCEGVIDSDQVRELRPG
jgi:glutaredoxin